MNRITNAFLKELLKTSSTPCVSVYMPTIRSGEEGEQNRIRYRNLLGEASERLQQRGFLSSEARAFLAPAQELDADSNFWKQMSDGIAAYCCAGRFTTLRLPASFEQSVTIGVRPHIKPLLPLLGTDGTYFLLVVSENHVKLLAGSRYELHELELGALPENLADALRYQQPEGQMLVHTGQPALPGKEGRVFYGQGGIDLQRSELQAYLREIDRALSPYLHGHESPLVFCGVEYLFPIYRELNTYPHLHAVPLTGNFDYTTTSELLAKVPQVLASYWDRQRQRDTQRLQDQIGRLCVSADIEALVSAAFQGRVEAIFVADDVSVQGTFNAAKCMAVLGGQWQDTEDLLDAAAAETLLHGGRAYAVKAKELPAGLVAATLYRYS